MGKILKSEGEIVSLALSKGHILAVFEKRVARKILGSTRKEVAAGWRKLHNDELHNL
jgi:hypothetical protein